MHLIEGDPRSPVAWLNYPRYATIDPYKPMGPNMMNETYYPVVVEKKGKGMRVGFSLLPPLTDDE